MGIVCAGRLPAKTRTALPIIRSAAIPTLVPWTKVQEFLVLPCAMRVSLLSTNCELPPPPPEIGRRDEEESSFCLLRAGARLFTIIKSPGHADYLTPLSRR